MAEPRRQREPTAAESARLMDAACARLEAKRRLVVQSYESGALAPPVRTAGEIDERSVRRLVEALVARVRSPGR